MKIFAEQQTQVVNGSDDGEITEPGELTWIRKFSTGAKSIMLEHWKKTWLSGLNSCMKMY